DLCVDEEDRRDSARIEGVSEEAHALNKKSPLSVAGLPSLKRSGELHPSVLAAGDRRSKVTHGLRGSHSACLATSTSRPNATLSRTARSASIFRSPSTPALLSPSMKRP